MNARQASTASGTEVRGTVWDEVSLDRILSPLPGTVEEVLYQYIYLVHTTNPPLIGWVRYGKTR